MTTRLTASAQRVQDALAALGMDFTVVELPSSTRTAQDAAASVACTVAQIVKSLIFRTKKTGRPILVLAGGANRVNEKRLKAVVDEAIGKADADFVREQTGFAIGGVPPVGHVNDIETYIDEDLLVHDEIWAAAGTPNAVFRLRSSDLVPMTNGLVISIT